MDRDFAQSLEHFSSDERALIERAYVYAEKAHAGQMRESGEPYFTHLVGTAQNLIAIGADVPTIAAGLLHDTIEDTSVTAEDIKREFGDEILFLVEGVTKLGKLKYRGLKRHVETLRKLFIATAQDTRVILIKLTDRLHNLRSIASLPREKQLRIAQETLEIYAPIAHRLGIGQLKGELEDAAFEIAQPENHSETKSLLEHKKNENQQELDRFGKELAQALTNARIPFQTIDHRIKHLYSLHKKLRGKDMNIDKVYDIAAVRIIVDTIEECYLALGIVHGTWTPLPGRIKDYIAMPKTNGYQSLHTTVFTGGGAIVEIQIRTKEMHAVAERGVASHVVYKEKSTGSAALRKINELRELLDLSAAKQTKPKEEKQEWLKELAEKDDTDNEDSYLHELKTDFFNDRILVFTPKGEVVDLPIGATPVDFAYAIHSDLGDHASGARVNGKFVALNTPLEHGDIVLIEKSANSKPTAKWLQWAKTSGARKKIRAVLGMVES